MREMVGGCCVCSDDRGWSENPLVYCDGQSCNVAVHQACYGIVTVPTGPWYCRKCESQERSAKVKCELCPSKYGALKRTDNSGWAHVVCALYIPEVRFGNVTTMEPIQLQLIPGERFNKTCYICEEKGKPSYASFGACMQCNKAGCKQQFHVTCAQGLGLLCEEAGNYLDNVKYCGYCQHHYSKLKKGGNVKTIPPYKPVSSENHNSDSNSEKEGEAANQQPVQPQQPPPVVSSKSSSNTSPQSSSKRKSSASGKSSTSKTSSSGSSGSKSSSSSSSSSSQQKSSHNSSSSSSKSSSDKSKVSSSSSPRGPSKNEEEDSSVSVSGSSNKKDTSKSDHANADSAESGAKTSESGGSGGGSSGSKYSKKRKTNSRTPTPVSVSPSVAGAEVGGVVSTSAGGSASVSVSGAGDKRGTPPVSDGDKVKKIKIDTANQSIIISQPIIALTAISTIKPTPHPTPIAEPAGPTEPMISALPPQPTVVVQQQPSSIPSPAPAQPINSLVVSVPLASTSLSPHHPLISNQTSVLTSVQQQQQQQGRNTPAGGGIMTGGGAPSMLAHAEAAGGGGGGGLKIVYEKQDLGVNHAEEDMELEVSPTPPEEPAKRARDKSERRSKKRSGGNSATNGLSAQLMSAVVGGVSSSGGSVKRGSRSQIPSPAPSPSPGGSYSSGGTMVPGPMAIKDSPPSSPESTDTSHSNGRGRPKGRKSAPAAVSTAKDTKDIKLFQNGVTAPHMLGNQLNPNSNMAQKMSDHLNSELEAHSIFNSSDNSSGLVGPQLHHRVVQSTRASSTGGSSTASGGSGLSSMLGGGGGTIPQTLDQLLERQWEQGSQFLMEQAQHFDIASLLSCLHQLRAENLRLEEHVSSLVQRRDHLLAVNARLAIPLTGQPNPQPSHPHTVNNIHPNVAGGGGGGGGGGHEVHRNRHSSGSMGAYPQGGQTPGVPVENGLPPDQYGHPHRSPAGSQQSPTVRW